MNKTAEKVAKLLIGEKVKRLYTQHALSQKEIAAKAGVDVKTIQRLENGETAKGDTLRRVADALGVPVTEFTMLLGLDNGSISQMSLPELNSLKMSLSELSESRKINREEHAEMREIIEMAEKSKVSLELPPLPPPPESVVATPNEPIEPLEKLNPLSTIKRILTETTPWVKYAPVDKNNPSLAHQLRDRGFVSQPFISDCGTYRVGFFKREFSDRGGGLRQMDLPSLFLAINTPENNEGLVIQLSPPRVHRYRKEGGSRDWPYQTFFYRSPQNTERILNINLEWFEIESDFKLYDYFFPDLLNAAMFYTPNFELTSGYIDKDYFSYSEESYAFDRLIRVDKMKPIEIAWHIEVSNPNRISLKYSHPIRTILAPKDIPLISVELKFEEDFSSKGKFSRERMAFKYPPKSHLTVTWPQFGMLEAKLLSKFYHKEYRKCSGATIDLLALMDENPTKVN